MQFSIKNPELEKLDRDMFSANKIYGMALNSLGKLPNIHAVSEFVKIAESLKERLKKSKTDDEFEKLFIENSLYNLEAQRAYLEYFTTGKKENVDELMKLILGENSLEIIKQRAKEFDYKGFWEYYLSYQEYTYRQIPSDDESLRPKFKEILEELKKDLLKYAVEHFNFPENYDFELVLGQPYSQRTSFHPTLRRMEISPSSFFVFKENEVKINVCTIIDSMFHEIIGHGRQELNSRNLPQTLQDNSINVSVPPLHIHSEGIAQITKNYAIDFMKKHKEKYNIQDDYIKQMELSFILDSSINLRIFYEYLKLKNLEKKNFNIEEEFKKIIDNHGLYILYETSFDSPLTCIKNATYTTGLAYITEILEDLKKEIGEEKFQENHSLINQAISVGVWNFRILPRFLRAYLRDKMK
ncbi:hypothetical protein GF386_05055 [Candidatus Pacearchaeota archaeon]|nr:hypothetical protein [Candidatus Pacearchaeota archaeon]MBD3283479.1 hypothetical protein [Candidatus Pacearchaeota archaeon]